LTEATVDVGLTHVALTATDPDASARFYARYAAMEVVHRRVDREHVVVWLSDRTRPFVLVLIQAGAVEVPLTGVHHLGVGVAGRDDLERLAARAADEGVLGEGPADLGPPVGRYAILRDPDGHQLELSHGQEVGLTVAGPGEA
jgi:catechol 2,3-dioxygenase-like lactoylglutathione lyase family enzyme